MIVIHGDEWIIIQTEPTREHIAAHHVRQAGIDAYLPLERWRVKMRGKWRTINRPLFRGYIFAMSNSSDDSHKIRELYGVCRIVHSPGDVDQAPARLSGDVIDAIKAAERGGVFDHRAKRRTRAVPLQSEAARDYLTNLVSSRYR